jgi:outer membrane protein assembly factor BamB
MWQKSLRGDFGGKPGEWAYSESPLVDGDVMVCTPGGKYAAIVALSKKTGDVIWKSQFPGDYTAAYSSALTVEVEGKRQYVQLLEKGLFAVDAQTGKFSWWYQKPTSAYGANIPTPVANDGVIYAGAAGTGGGAVRPTMNQPGTITPVELYFNPKLPTAVGGAVLIDGFLYGSGQVLVCANFRTGEIKWSNRSIAPASICFAAGRLYLHGENGDVALVEATPEAYREKGRFTPSNPPKRLNQMEKAWAYPVVANGRLYIRDQDCLWCYEVNGGGVGK